MTGDRTPPSERPTDGDAVEQLKELYVAVVADVLDRIGWRTQVMRSDIRPVTEERLVVGRAYTVRAVPLSTIEENPYEREIAAVDALPAGSVAVVGTERTSEAAVWGELLATRAANRGCVAAIVDGGVRDLHAMRDMGMPVWASAVSANDSRGRLDVVEHGRPTVCGGVLVSAGDVVMADLDGVVVIPQALVADVATAAAAKVGKETLSRADLASGKSAAEVYSRHGVL